MTPDELLRAVVSMIILENKQHKSKIGYLRKIKSGVKKIIDSKKVDGNK
jgi:hypothetical protein